MQCDVMFNNDNRQIFIVIFPEQKRSLLVIARSNNRNKVHYICIISAQKNFKTLCIFLIICDNGLEI